MYNILITGGAGYIGSELINKLINLGQYNITVIDKMIFGQNSLNEFLKEKKFTLINEDVRNFQAIKKFISSCDIVIPLAALVGAPLCKKFPKETEDRNLNAIKFLVKNLSKDQKIIFPVTNSGYGIGKKDEMCTEDSPLNPISLYGKTKVESEKVIMEKENSVAFRLATVFGCSRRMRVDLLVNNFTYIASKKKYIKLFEPHFRRNYVHVLDVVDSFIFAIDNFNNVKNEIFNLGLTEANLTKEQLCKKIQEYVTDFIYEISTDGTDEDKRDYFVSNDKIESAGFKPKRNLDYGIKELIKLFESPNFQITDNISNIKI